MPLFVVLLVGTVLLVGALTFVPALALGPIVEHLMLLGSDGSRNDMTAQERFTLFDPDAGAAGARRLVPQARSARAVANPVMFVV